MIFGNITALFLLLLLPLLFLLHIILRRMETKEVSSLLIWERVRKKRKYRLPTILLLLLQLLIVIFFSLSLADIKIPFTIPMRRDNSVLIIDNSASMSVIEDGESRLDDAKDKAINVIRGSLGEIMIITSSNPPEVISSYSNDHDQLIKAVRSIEQTDLSNGVEEAMKIAGASLLPEGSIIMISDGAFGYHPSEGDNFKFIRAGREFRDNIAITDFHLREKVEDDNYELYLTLSNFSREENRCRLEIFRKDDLIIEETINLQSGEVYKKVYHLTSESEKEIRAEIEPEGTDLLSSDNRASAYISSNRRKRVLLVTPGNFFLEKALESIPGIYLERYTGMLESETTVTANTKPLMYSGAGIPVQEIPDNFDVVVYDRIPPLKKDETGRFLYIDVVPSGLRDSLDKIQPQGISKTVSHPVTESVDLSSVTVLQAHRPLAGPQIKELVSGGNTGLLYSLESRYLKFIYIPFDLTDSDLPLRSSFPVLISNSIAWLTEGYAREEINQLKTGDLLLTGREIPEQDRSEITLPSGRKEDIEGTVFPQTLREGLYRTEYAGEFQYHAVNITNRDESDISSRFPEVTEENREEKTGEYKFPLLTILLIVALLFIALEWLLQEDKW